MLRLLYTTIIRPHLDYACVVWNPYQSGDIRVLEQVQRRVTRACSSLSHLSYHDRLMTLNLSLLYRWQRMDMMMYKTLKGRVTWKAVANRPGPVDTFFRLFYWEQYTACMNY